MVIQQLRATTIFTSKYNEPIESGFKLPFKPNNPDIRFAEGGKTKRYMKKIKRGGITYGKSHAEGGMPVKNQSTGDMLEVEGGEGIVNKRSMASDKMVKLNGKEMTICEAVSQLNQLEGGVQFSCDDVSDRQFIEAMAQGGELERGVRTEQEHIQVLKDLYAKRITPKQASERIAKDHLNEDSRYYSKLAKMEGKMADGGEIEMGKTYLIGRPEIFKSGRFGRARATYKTIRIGENGEKIFGQQDFSISGSAKNVNFGENYIKLTQKEFDKMQGKMADGGEIYDDEGNVIDLKVGDKIIEFKQKTPNNPKSQIGGEGHIIEINNNMAKILYEPNNFEQWRPLKNLKKIDEGKMADGGTTADNPYAEFGVLKSFKGDAIKKLDKLEEKSTNYCDIDKKHCSSSIGIDRKEMPQIYEEYMDKYIDFLEEEGVGYEMQYEVEVGKLKPTQENISVPRIKKILTRLENGYYTDAQGAKLNPLKRRLIATKDGYILDGHHRWATLLFLSPKNKMDVLRINANIKDLVELSKKFDYASTSQFAYGGKVSIKAPNYTSLDTKDLQTTYIKRGGFPQKGLVLKPLFAEEFDATSQVKTGKKGYTDDAFEVSIGKASLQRSYKRAWMAERDIKTFIFNRIDPSGTYSDLGLTLNDFDLSFTYSYSSTLFLMEGKRGDKIKVQFSWLSGSVNMSIYIPPKFQSLKDGERLFELLFDALNFITSNADRDWNVAAVEQKEKAKESKEKKKTISDLFSKAVGMPKLVTSYDPRHSYRLKTEDELLTQFGKDFFNSFRRDDFLSKGTTRKLLGLKIPKKIDFIVRYLLAPSFYSHREKVEIYIDHIYDNLEDSLGLKIEKINLRPFLITIDQENAYSDSEIEPYIGAKILNAEEVKSNPNVTDETIANFYKKTLVFDNSWFWTNWTKEEAQDLNTILFAKDGNNFVVIPEVWNWLKYVNFMFDKNGLIYNENRTKMDFGKIIFERLDDADKLYNTSNDISKFWMRIISFVDYEDQQEIDGVKYCASKVDGDENKKIYIIPKVFVDISRYADMENFRTINVNGNSRYRASSQVFQEEIKKALFFFPLTKIPSIFRTYDAFADDKTAYFQFKEQLRINEIMIDSESPFFESVNFNDYNIKFDISFVSQKSLFFDKNLYNSYLQHFFRTEENANVKRIQDVTFKNIANEKMYELFGKSLDAELIENLSYIMKTSPNLRIGYNVGGELMTSYLYYGDNYLEKDQLSRNLFKTDVKPNGKVVMKFDLSSSSNQSNSEIFDGLEAPIFYSNFVENALQTFSLDKLNENINMYSLLGIDERLEGIELCIYLAQNSYPMNLTKYSSLDRWYNNSFYDGYVYCVEPILVSKDSQILSAKISSKRNQFEKDIEALKTLMSIYKEDEIQVYSTLLKKLRETQKRQESFIQKRYFQNDLTNLLKLYASKQEVGGQRDVTQVVQSGMTSPTGAPSELDIVQYSLVRTAEFKKWFGDWEFAYETQNYEGVSKAINPRTAEPIVLYHGKGNMKAEATYFNLTGFPAKYLGANLSYSQWFANAYQELRVVYEFYTRILNPLDFEKLGLAEITPIEFKRLVSVLYGYDITTRLIAEDRPQKLWMIVRSNPLMLKELRDKTPYDGIIMYEDNPQDILPSGETNSTLDFVVFNNNQIKSADTRNNTFLLDSPDFRFERGGLITKHI